MGARIGAGVALALVVSVAGGCAGKGTSGETREVYVVSVPHGAAVSLEGRSVGRTPVSVALPAAGRHPGPLAVRLERTGFRPEVRSFRGDAAPDRLVVVLRPDLASAPAVAPAPDDAEGLYRMAGLLVDARRCRDALEYLDRTLELAPRHALAHRERGECLLDLGEPALAIEHLSRYLLLVPDAPDAAQVQAQLDGLRGAKTVERGTSASDE